MEGLEEFLAVFGDITILQVVYFVIACIFIYFVYKKVKEYLITKHDRETERDKQLQETLTFVKEHQEDYEQIKREIQELQKAQTENNERLAKMEEDIAKRERNKLRDRLLQNYRYYTNPETNPSLSWNTMEAEAFWELFKDYEDAGGDGYIHTEVQPAMNKLIIVDIEDE